MLGVKIADGTKGDYIYYEKEYADVFILNNRTGAIAFNVTASTSSEPSTPGDEGTDTEEPGQGE